MLDLQDLHLVDLHLTVFKSLRHLDENSVSSVLWTPTRGPPLGLALPHFPILHSLIKKILPMEGTLCVAWMALVAL